jgi:hypothetical protein
MLVRLSRRGWTEIASAENLEISAYDVQQVVDHSLVEGCDRTVVPLLPKT